MAWAGLVPCFFAEGLGSPHTNSTVEVKGFLGLPTAGLREQAGCHKVIPKVGNILGVSVVHYIQGCHPSIATTQPQYP